jgi:endonuclease/exonuclease/phosphatase family metal-dependent hydrolase
MEWGMAEKVELKIMSYNIWNYNEPWKDRRKLIVDTILEADPDVVGLQEIRDDRKFNPVGHDQARQIAERTGFDYQYQPAMVYSRTPRSVEGLCIMSRHSIDSTSYVELSKSPSDEEDFHQRIVLNGTVALPVGSLEFFVTHFSLSQEMRVSNAVELLQFVNTFNSHLPKFIVGDFNCTPDELPIKILTGMESVRDQKTIGNFVDVWEETRSGPGSYTHGERRIDFIFMIPSPWAEATVNDVSILNKNENGLFASDHSAITSTIKISSAS